MTGRSPEGTAQTDVAVVGTGAAGLAAVLRLVEAGVDTVLITKASLGGGATAWAQGGLAAVLDESDSTELHAHDTLTAGAGLCDPAAVGTLAALAPTVIERLQAIGAQFDTDADGTLALGLEGGHHARRIVHAGGDASGAEVSRVLRDAALAAIASGRLRLLEHTMAVDALTDATGTVQGLHLLVDGRPTLLPTRAVVLATGGIGQVWAATTNPPGATGDGLALALRAGATVRDVEFLQFHPTMLAVPPDHVRPGDRGVLVSEAVRGEGATLRDLSGRPVMAGIHPLGDLAPRDVVAAAMEAALLRDGVDHLLLDGTHLTAADWQHHFPTILRLCRERGVDPVVEPIPVRPAAHYHCGGVAADLDGHTSVPGLYAVGEVAATGVHGANRLASNSITEALVAGDRAGTLLARRLVQPHVANSSRAATPRIDPPSLPTGALPDLGLQMAHGAGVLRTGTELTALLDQLDASTTGEPASDDPCDRVDEANRLLVARAVVTAALHRTESRGCHRRSDHPATEPGWQRHQTWVLQDDRLVPADHESGATATNEPALDTQEVA